MTDDQLNEIEARCRAATKPPWRLVTKDTKCVIVWTPTAGTPSQIRAGCITLAQCGPSKLAYEKNECNGRLMAHAREDLPRLVVEARRLKAALAQQRRDVAAQCASIASTAADLGLLETGEECANRIAERILREFGLE